MLKTDLELLVSSFPKSGTRIDKKKIKNNTLRGHCDIYKTNRLVYIPNPNELLPIFKTYIALLDGVDRSYKESFIEKITPYIFGFFNLGTENDYFLQTLETVAQLCKD